MAACKADNFYRPFDYDPNNRKKEIDKKRKEGTLKTRIQGARKIRFEMPFHVRCTSCQKMIAKGVRFNAIKKKSGRYLGTIIFSFEMCCPGCKAQIIIKTDPKNCEYLLVQGCIKYEVDYDDSQNNTFKIQTPEEGEKMNRNAFYKLETQAEDIRKANEIKPNLERLYEYNQIYENDFDLNKVMRNRLKNERRVIREIEKKAIEKGVDMDLLPVNSEDRMKANKVKFAFDNGRFKIRDKIRFTSILFQNQESDYMNKETTLLKKKHLMDRSIQLSLEDLKDKDKEKVNDGCFDNAISIHLNRNIILKRKERS